MRARAPSTSPPTPLAPAARRTATLIAVALFGVGLALSSTSLRAPFVLDDVSKIVQNPDIRSLAALPQRLVYPYAKHQVLERNDPSRPVVFATYALNYALGGLSPRGWHLFNAAAHALCGVFVFFLVLRLLRARRPDEPPGDARGARWPLVVASLTALLFLASPMNAGTVFYVYGRSDVLGALFMLAAALLHLRGSRASRFGAVLLFAVALFTKQSAIVLPALLFALDAVTAPAERSRWRAALLHTLPYGALALAYVGYRLVYFGAIGDLEGHGQTWGAAEYASVQPWVLWRYVQLLFVPVGLSIDHQLLPESVSVVERVLAGLLLLGGLFAAVVSSRRGGREGLLCALGIAWFLVCLAPTSSLLPTVDAMVERRAYLASAGLYFAALVWLPRLAAHLVWRRVALAAVGAAVLIFAALTFMRAHVHGDARRLWTDVIAKYPKSVRGTNNLANLLVEAKEYRAALAAFERLLAWNAGDYIAHNNFGDLLTKPESGFADEARAIRAFETAIAQNPTYAAPHYNLGRIAQQRGDATAAERRYLRALELQPGYALAHSNLGLLYFHQGRRDEARARYLEALRLDPECGPAQHNLALLERTPKDAPPRALRPEPAASPPGAAPETILAGKPRPPGASAIPVESVESNVLTRLYEEALTRQPNNRAVRRKYADLCRARKLPCARTQYEALLAQDPNDAEVRALLDALRR